MTLGQIWPPADTPVFRLDPRYENEHIPTTGDFRTGYTYNPLGPEMPGSYLDIAPDFTPATTSTHCHSAVERFSTVVSIRKVGPEGAGPGALIPNRTNQITCPRGSNFVP